MRDPVENPMTHDQKGKRGQRPAILTCDTAVGDSKGQTPHHQHGQRVRVRIAYEVERREGSIAGIYSYAFNATCDE
jgi:hypothetical protein